MTLASEGQVIIISIAPFMSFGVLRILRLLVTPPSTQLAAWVAQPTHPPERCPAHVNRSLTREKCFGFCFMNFMANVKLI